MYLLWALFLAGLVMIYAKWWGWYGGFAWGPRFFVFASIPASMAIAVALRHGRSPWLRLGALAALVLAAWVGLDGVVFGREALSLGQERCNIALEHLCWYVPEFSVLWHPFVASPPVDARGIVYICYVGVVLLRLAAPTVRPLMRDLVVMAACVATDQRRQPRWRF